MQSHEIENVFFNDVSEENLEQRYNVEITNITDRISLELIDLEMEYGYVPLFETTIVCENNNGYDIYFNISFDGKNVYVSLNEHQDNDLNKV